MTPREIIDEISSLQDELAESLGFQTQTTIQELQRPPQIEQVLLVSQKYLAVLSLVNFECEQLNGTLR